MAEDLSFELFDISHCCKVLDVSSSGFYAWLKRLPSKRKTEDERIYQKIKKHWEDSRKTYGRRPKTKKLKQEGEVVGENRVHRIMNQNNIQGVCLIYLLGKLWVIP